MNSELHRLLQWMAICIEHSEAAEAGARSTAGTALFPIAAVTAGELIKPNARLTALQRLEIYNGGYFSRLKEVLEGDFRALRHALGDEPWFALALGYCFTHPSRHPNLNRFNRRMPAYLGARTELAHGAFLQQLAGLEVAMTEAFDAAEFRAMDMTRLQQLTPEQWQDAVLVTNPSLRLLRADYPTNRYLQAVYDGGNPAIPGAETSQVAVFRKDHQVWRHDLPLPIFQILHALHRGTPLAQALQSGGEHDEDFHYWFSEWSNDGIFVDLRLSASS